jgi:hypothetical protein
MRRPGSPAPRKSGKNVIGRRLFEDEYEYEKKHEQSIGPKSSIERFGLVKNLLLAIDKSESIGKVENDSVQDS